LLGWQLRLRLLFLARINLLKYRLRLPGFELPAPVDDLQKAFDARIARILDAMADRAEGGASQVDEDTAGLLEELEQAVSNHQADQSGDAPEIQMQTFLPLLRRVVEIVRSLDQEMEYIEVSGESRAWN
jgi:multidrug resistance protein MdtO